MVQSIQKYSHNITFFTIMSQYYAYLIESIDRLQTRVLMRWLWHRLSLETQFQECRDVTLIGQSDVNQASYWLMMLVRWETHRTQADMTMRVVAPGPGPWHRVFSPTFNITFPGYLSPLSPPAQPQEFHSDVWSRPMMACRAGPASGSDTLTERGCRQEGNVWWCVMWSLALAPNTRTSIIAAIFCILQYSNLR